MWNCRSILITNWINFSGSDEDRSIIPLSNYRLQRRFKSNSQKCSTFLLYSVSQVLWVWSSHKLDNSSWLVLPPQTTTILVLFSPSGVVVAQCKFILYWISQVLWVRFLHNLDYSSWFVHNPSHHHFSSSDSENKGTLQFPELASILPSAPIFDMFSMVNEVSLEHFSYPPLFLESKTRSPMFQELMWNG